MSAIVLVGSTAAAPVRTSRVAPLRLAIFYGYPSQVNGANGKLEIAAAAFEPYDMFGTAIVPLNSAGGGNPGGAPHMVGRSDFFLLESFQVRLGRFADDDAAAGRIDRAVHHRDRSSARLAAVTTTEQERYQPE